MANHEPTTSPTRRAALALGGAFASVGLTAGAATIVRAPDNAQSDPDAELLALRPRLQAAVLAMGQLEMAELPSDDWITETTEALVDACSAIVSAPPARTADGRALKAAAAMHQLRDSFGFGTWPGDGEEMAWLVLSEMAGNVYVPPARPEKVAANCEPGRA